MKILQDGIVPFLICIAFYALCFLTPLWPFWKSQLREAQERLVGWRGYEVKIDALGESSRRSMHEGDSEQLGEHLRTLGFEDFHEYILYSQIRFMSEVSREQAPLATAIPTATKQRVQLTHLAFVRIWRHPQHGCLAFLCRARATRTGHIDHLLKMVSIGQSWSYTSMLGFPQGADVGRSGHRLFSHFGAPENLQAGAGLLEKHLARRALIAQAGDFSWEAPTSTEEVVRLEHDYAANVRKFGKQHSPVSYLIWEWRSRRNRQSEWLGELSGKLPSL